MLFSKIRSDLDQIKKIVEGFVNSQSGTIAILEEEIARLREENKRLLDRVMAVDYQKFQIYSQVQPPEVSLKEVTFDYDEDNVGEIVEGAPEDVGRDS